MNPEEMLAQLRPPDAPQAIGWWPLAPGWWMLAALLLCALIACAFWLRRRHLQGKAWRQAQQLAEQQYLDWQQHRDDARWLQQSGVLVKRCISLLGEPAAGSLHGTRLQQWLTDICPDSEPGLLHALANEQYRQRPQVQADSLQPALLQLIRQLQEAARA